MYYQYKSIRNRSSSILANKLFTLIENNTSPANYQKVKNLPKPSIASILIGNTGSPSVLCCIDLEKPEEDSKWAFVSDFKIGLLPHHDSLLMSKESQIRAHKEELNQRSRNLTLTYFFMHLELARCLLP